MPRSAASPEAGGRPQLALRIQLRNPVRAPVERDLLRTVARRVVINEGLTGPLRLEIELSDDAGLRAANRRQRGVDAATDVLSFPLLAELQPGSRDFALPPGEPRHLGEVLISYERACAQAAEYGHGIERELCYLLAHGVLHLLGYDHQDPDQQRIMRRKEEAVLSPLGLNR